MSVKRSNEHFDAASLYSSLANRVSESIQPGSSAAPLTFREFIRKVNPRYQFYRHCEELIAVLQRVADGELQYVMIFLAPRHSKSETASRLFPAYWLYRHPDQFIGLCSYSAELAHTLARTARDNYRAVGGIIRDDAKAVGHWETPQRGGMWAAGVGGPISGKGFALGLIDDPIKNAEEAESETIREGHKEWYRSTFHNRAEPAAAFVHVQTRWHTDDLAGYLLAQETADDAEGQPQHWYIVHLPALAEEDPPAYPPSCTVHPDWRLPGEALCPQRYNEAALARKARVSGSHFWAAMYQQRPAPRAGGMFKRAWWRFSDPELWIRSHALQIIQVWDTAFKAKQENDYSVCSTWALMPDGVYVLDVWRDKVEFPELKREARAQYAKWQPSVVLIEDKASGQSLIQELQRETGIPLIAVPADADKVVRAAAATPYVEAGRVFLPEGAAWVSDWIDEHARFPRGAHDDQVDTTSIALRRLVLGGEHGMDEDAADAYLTYTGY